VRCCCVVALRIEAEQLLDQLQKISVGSRSTSASRSATWWLGEVVSVELEVPVAPEDLPRPRGLRVAKTGDREPCPLLSEVLAPRGPRLDDRQAPWRDVDIDPDLSCSTASTLPLDDRRRCGRRQMIANSARQANCYQTPGQGPVRSEFLIVHDAKGPATCELADHGPFTSGGWGFEPPRAFTEHAFQVARRGRGWVCVNTYVQVSGLREHERMGASGWVWRRTATRTATAGSRLDPTAPTRVGRSEWCVAGLRGCRPARRCTARRRQ
jgi:hypothetical protein